MTSHDAHILMCPPDYYGIEYEINPWMNRQRQCDHASGRAAVAGVCGACWNRLGADGLAA